MMLLRSSSFLLRGGPSLPRVFCPLGMRSARLRMPTTILRHSPKSTSTHPFLSSMQPSSNLMFSHNGYMFSSTSSDQSKRQQQQQQQQQEKEEEQEQQQEQQKQKQRQQGWSYSRFLDEYPVLSRSVTSMILVSTGDIVAQAFIEEKGLGNLNLRRLVTMGFLGLALIGPVVSQWYVVLYRMFPQPGFQGAMIRMALDQGIFAGCFLMLFLTSLFTLEKPLAQVIPSLRAQVESGEYWSSLCVNWKLWIPAQVLNFWVIPLKWQMLYVNFVALLWNTYLSYAAHKKIVLKKKE